MKNGTAIALETFSFEREPRLPGLGENFKNFDTSYLRRLYRGEIGGAAYRYWVGRRGRGGEPSPGKRKERRSRWGGRGSSGVLKNNNKTGGAEK